MEVVITELTKHSKLNLTKGDPNEIEDVAETETITIICRGKCCAVVVMDTEK